MQTSQLEAHVLQMIDSLQLNQAVEDDRFELKREWPDIDKARQLAAAANQARGEHLIYVIGVDEKTGEVTDPGEQDPATWWAGFEARFDDVAPELVRHIRIAIDADKHVIALLFRTDRTPYVVKVLNGGAVEREVPIRSGTRTRSAKRHELLRLLAPSLGVPRMEILECNLSVYSERPGGAYETGISGSLEVFFEHVNRTPVFLPSQSTQLEISFGEFSYSLNPAAHRSKDAPEPSYGVYPRHDGVALFGPGAVYFSFNRDLTKDEVRKVKTVGAVTLKLSFGVSGTDKSTQLSLALHQVQVPPADRAYGIDANWNLLNS